MKLYLGNTGQSYRAILGTTRQICHVEHYSEIVVLNGVSLLTADEERLKDINNVYITTKESE